MGKQTFTAGQVLTAAEMNSLQENDYNWTVATKTAAYVLAAGDEGTRIVMDSASATTITVDDSVFSAGDVVWIHNVGAGTCTITAGTATVNTDGSLALEQYQGGQLFFTSASSAIFFPNVGAQAGGKILQVVSTTKTDTFSASITSGSSSAVTGLTATITPSSTSSKVLVQVMLTGAVATADRCGLILTRDGSAISGAIADADGNRGRVTGGLTDREYDPNTTTLVYLDSPASTSALTYGVDLYSIYTVTHYINRGQNNDDQNFRFRAVSTITVMEVAA